MDRGQGVGFAEAAIDIEAPADLAQTADATGDAMQATVDALLARRRSDGHWVFELEADATMPADHVLLEHYLDRIDEPRQARIAAYLRRTQHASGGWPLYPGGGMDLSASVRAYLALKATGDAASLPHMIRARDLIHAMGGAERSNVFTRIQLALFGILPWRAVPAMPVEIMHLPRWFPFNVWAVSYWSRVTIAPLAVLQALRPKARNPRGIGIPELFLTPPESIRRWQRDPSGSLLARAFEAVDSALHRAERHFPRKGRKAAIDKAVAFVRERLNGEDGLGAIYPPMAYTVMMLDALGVPDDAPEARTAWKAVLKLVVERGDEAYIQPCVSPVWDTALAAHAIAEAGRAGATGTRRAVEEACDWLLPRQITDIRGDWSVNRPDLRPGGWAFQYRNDHYPDVDDTAVVGMLLHRAGLPRHREAIERARIWVVGMQDPNGSWGAFDVGNDRAYLNAIPFADHGALIDPPSADVTARCVSFLCQVGHPSDRACIDRAVAYLRREQESDGSWFGRWGTNHLYGTWSVVGALTSAGLAPDDPSILRAAGWLLSVQRDDGGWGEDARSYEAGHYVECGASLPSQTAWALLALMAAGLRDHPAVSAGIAYLIRAQRDDGEWDEAPFNAVGFPRVFYLRYDGYRLFFPLLAMARHANGGERPPARAG